MKSSTASMTLGAILSLGVLVALPLGLGWLPDSTDLSVEVATPHPYQLLHTKHSAPSPVSLSPSSMAPRITLQTLPESLDTGLHLRTWQAVWGGRFERSATLPLWVGPFQQEGTYTCGLTATLGAGLFDTAKAGIGLNALFRKKLATQFPKVITHQNPDITLRFPPVQDANLKITLQDRQANLHATVKLDDGTLLAARFATLLRSRGGTPVLTRVSPIHATWTGPTRDEVRRKGRELGAGAGALAGGLIGLLVAGPAGAAVGGGVGAKAGSDIGARVANSIAEVKCQEEATKIIDQALSSLSLGFENLREPYKPFSDRPLDEIRFKLANHPTISQHGITLPLCMSVQVAEPRVDDAIAPFAPTLPDNPTTSSPDLVSDSKTIKIVADANGINQVLYFLWQSGTLRKLGQSSAVLDALPKELRVLAFEVTGFDPRLPPIVPTASPNASETAIPVLLANVAIGTWGNRTVVGHALTSVRFQPLGDSLALSATLDRVFVNCAQSLSANHTRLTPCLSDLLPAVRETMATTSVQHRLTDAELLRQLPTLAFQGVRLSLSGLQASTGSNPPHIQVQVDATLLGDL